MGAWIEKLECGGDVEKQHHFKKKFIERLRHSTIAEATDKANEQHYEVPSDFFLTVRFFFFFWQNILLSNRLLTVICVMQPLCFCSSAAHSY
jgi:hypothetical protein